MRKNYQSIQKEAKKKRKKKQRRGGTWDFPGGPVVKNPPSNAGDTGSIPGWGTKIPHATGQLNLCALEPCTPQLLSLHALGPTHHN